MSEGILRIFDVLATGVFHEVSWRTHIKTLGLIE